MLAAAAVRRPPSAVRRPPPSAVRRPPPSAVRRPPPPSVSATAADYISQTPPSPHVFHIHNARSSAQAAVTSIFNSPGPLAC